MKQRKQLSGVVLGLALSALAIAGPSGYETGPGVLTVYDLDASWNDGGEDGRIVDPRELGLAPLGLPGCHGTIFTVSKPTKTPYDDQARLSARLHSGTGALYIDFLEPPDMSTYIKVVHQVSAEEYAERLERSNTYALTILDQSRLQQMVEKFEQLAAGYESQDKPKNRRVELGSIKVGPAQRGEITLTFFGRRLKLAGEEQKRPVAYLRLAFERVNSPPRSSCVIRPVVREHLWPLLVTGPLLYKRHRSMYPHLYRHY